MKSIGAVKIVLLTLIIVLTIVNKAAAQTEPEKDKKSDFGYSQISQTKPESTNSEKKSEVAAATQCKIFTVETIIQGASENSSNLPAENKIFESRSVVCKPLETGKPSDNSAVPPTDIYKIGVGDVLYISLQNAPAKASTYFTVLEDGTIDYPLAGEMITVGGLTTDEVQNLLKAKIKLYENPQISVKVREHASHAITVLGLVEKPGEKYLPREAVPLFMIRAEAIVQPRADTLVLKRAGSKTQQIDLKDVKSEDALIFPGDILEFKVSGDAGANSIGERQFYFIGGGVRSAGQKDFHQGLTLTQAILASGGLKKTIVKKVILRRKNQTGLLSPMEFNLNYIKDGKQPDPLIQAGDTIEVIN